MFCFTTVGRALSAAMDAAASFDPLNALAADDSFDVECLALADLDGPSTSSRSAN